jgi:hypothetical protein
MFIEQAGVDVKNLKSRDIVMPANPKHTYQEWLDIFAAQKTSPESDSNYKKGTEPQPGKDLPHIRVFE